MVHPFRKLMDCRIKSGNDEKKCDAWEIAARQRSTGTWCETCLRAGPDEGKDLVS